MKRQRPIGECVRCREERPILSRGLCQRCFKWLRRRNLHTLYPKVGCRKSRQCVHIYADGTQCPKNKGLRKDGRINSRYCPGHTYRKWMGWDMDAPFKESDRSGTTECAHVYPDGVKCTEPRYKNKNGTYHGPYCVLHRSRQSSGRDMNAPKGMVGQREILVIR